MTQEKLDGLATITLENDTLDKIKYEIAIGDLISKNIERMILFSRPKVIFFLHLDLRLICCLSKTFIVLPLKF
jgi:hypothetical protein